MIPRLVAILALLSLAVITTVSTAHAGMDAGDGHVMHSDEVMQAHHGIDHSCDGDQACGAVDSKLCEFVCAGLSVFVAPPGSDAPSAVEPAHHPVATDLLRTGRAPELYDRPPKLGFI